MTWRWCPFPHPYTPFGLGAGAGGRVRGKSFGQHEALGMCQAHAEGPRGTGDAEDGVQELGHAIPAPRGLTV